MAPLAEGSDRQLAPMKSEIGAWGTRRQLLGRIEKRRTPSYLTSYKAVYGR